ncbi:hypothetical protein [Synechococcus sp. LTW-R]|uniref:hypothetical protein n=1 Tax=Synechococcus sp. LTW-R TaxID=2751170 RepID=UPI0016246161|nr:hypothetical protein [Synechococcus sp. LTW-R]QNG29303.1 hypothetical protein H0O22_11345 [Synechococcus sp. LTW-R]
MRITLRPLSILLLTPIIVCSGGAAEAFWGAAKEWPTDWKQFKYPPSDRAKPYATIRFTKDIDEACRRYEVDKRASERASKRYAVINRIALRKALSGEFTEDEANDYSHNEYEQKWKTRMVEVASGVEVLRQWGVPDWKEYSLHHYYGVGEKMREYHYAGKFLSMVDGYGALPVEKIEDICSL